MPIFLFRLYGYTTIFPIGKRISSPIYLEISDIYMEEEDVIKFYEMLKRTLS